MLPCPRSRPTAPGGDHDRDVEQQPLRRLEVAAGALEPMGDPGVEALVARQHPADGLLGLGQGVAARSSPAPPRRVRVGDVYVATRSTMLSGPAAAGTSMTRSTTSPSADGADPGVHHPVRRRPAAVGRDDLGDDGAPDRGVRRRGDLAASRWAATPRSCPGCRSRCCGHLSGDQDLGGQHVGLRRERLGERGAVGADHAPVAGLGELLEASRGRAALLEGDHVDQQAALGDRVDDRRRSRCRWCRRRRRAPAATAVPSSPAISAAASTPS